MTNSIIKIEALKTAISRTKHGVTRINDVVRDVNTVWTDAGEPYPLPFGEYKRRTWLLADLERMLAQMIDEAHAEALVENDEFDGIIHDGLTPEQRAIHIRRQGIDIYGDRFKVMLDADHAEALEENYRFGWLTNRFNLFWGGCDFSTRRSMTERAHDEALVINAEMAQREMKLNAIWRGTHRDYRSSTDGVRSIMVCRGATCLVPLSELTDKEINQRSNLWK
ncbi:TPA: hypothetical protein MNM60_000917 [Citrobacter freundii]|uniref:hypothetical protein n=1 Tax=Citrobacter freundii TaxID=546 RepID=UPI0032AFBF0D|nr:hypothetical protein [Citrobacter freundii]HCA1227168.1 hypothetical protein [Citrobacter freundii]HCA1437566.1 hypothetical protein [Citrobacter freundii]HCA1861235.1 hypothetical protein [Citrobacter freundii]HCA2842198.1 hypothetical protein [Citrobacter freundii]